MDKPTDKPEPEEPDDLEIEKEVAEEQEEKYGGRDRWFLTVAFLILLPCIYWTIHQKDVFALFFVAMAVLCGIWAAINWYHWLKKSPSEKAAAPAPEFVAPFKIVGHPAPFTRDEFFKARGALGVNLMFCFFLCLFAVAGFMVALSPHVDLVTALVAGTIGIVAGWSGLSLGKRGTQQARYLGCPGCKDLLSSQSQSVLRTGHCRKCGAVVISGQPAAAPDADDDAEPQFAEPASRGTSRHPSFLPRGFKHDRRRLWDIVVLFAFPAVCILLLRGPEGLSAAAVMMALGYGCIFYFFPDRDGGKDIGRRPKPAAQKKPAAVAAAANAASGVGAVADKAPWLDFGLILLLPVVVVAWLLYLVWTHTVLGKLGLGAATVAIPAAVVLVSWFVLQHEKHHVKKTGVPPPGALMWGLLAIWIAAVIIFAVCLVSWIEKFGLQW